MTTSDLLEITENYKVKIVSFPLPLTQSLSIETQCGCVIGMDNSAHMTSAEENVHLGHEIGHCLYGGFYSKNTAFDIIERHEVRADKWYILRAIPKSTLYALLRQNYDIWEIAEMLNTTEDYVRRAYYYYQDNA